MVSAPQLAGEPHRTATLALKGIATAYGVPFMSPEPAPATVPATAPAKEEPEVSTYDFNEMTLRVVQIDGEPWFVAVDIQEALGLTKDAMKYHGRKTLSKDEKGVVELPLNGERGNPRRNLISESGLYKLITRSDKPEAKPFKEWVTRDVLPSIRKTGSYSLTDGEDTTPSATGEIVQHSGAETVEAEFKAMVSTRFNRRTQQIAALKAELHELEIAQDKDGNLLSLLAA